jgi:type IV pilus assembly protein PilB
MSQRIVEIIRKANLLNKEDLAKAVEFSTRDNIPFMLFLFSNNMVSEEAVMPLLEQGLGVERIDLDSQDIESAVLDCVPREVAMQYRIIPINRLANNLIVAGGDPTDLALIDKISARLSSKVKIKLASELAITRAINKYYKNKV